MPEAARLDAPGLVLSALGLGCAMYGVSEGPIQGWTSITVLAAIVVGLVLLTAPVIVELGRNDPLVDLRLFGNRLFRACTSLYAFGSVAYLGALYLAALPTARHTSDRRVSHATGTERRGQPGRADGTIVQPDAVIRLNGEHRPLRSCQDGLERLEPTIDPRVAEASNCRRIPRNSRNLRPLPLSTAGYGSACASGLGGRRAARRSRTACTRSWQAQHPNDHSDLFAKSRRQFLQTPQLRDAPRRRPDSLISLIKDLDRVSFSEGEARAQACVKWLVNPVQFCTSASRSGCRSAV